MSKFIYSLLGEDQKPRYVGVSKNPQERARLHYSSRFKKTTPVAQWLCTLNKVPDVWVIQQVPDEFGWKAETYWIRLLREVPSISLLNKISSYRESGHRHSPETKIKISISLQGKSHTGYLKGIRNQAAKLSEQEVREIFAAEGSTRSIARQYNVSHVTVYGIKQRYTWKHLAL